MTDIPVCLPPDRNPRKARLAVPAQATDCHTHIFGPVRRYPYSPERGYTPPDSSLEQMQHMHRQLGIERVVFTQPSVYGTDNAAILDAMAGMPERARAVAAVGMGVGDAELARLDTLGVRGIRLNLYSRGGMPITLEEVVRLAERIQAFGWHLEFLFQGSAFGELEALFRSLPVPVCFAHFAFMPAKYGADYPPFRQLVKLFEEGNTWIKLSSPYSVSATPLPPYQDLTPLAQALVAVRPDRVLWASNWPHPNRLAEHPDDADLLEALADWVPDAAVRQRILVDNPAELYRFA